MNRIGMGLGAALVVTLIVGGLVWSKDRDTNHKDEGNRQMVAMAITATVTIEQAMKTALENFPGRVVEAGLVKRYGKTVWEVEIMRGASGIMVVQLDAMSGSVIDTGERK
jgi:uncharacterized membrane protein YkoI